METEKLRVRDAKLLELALQFNDNDPETINIRCEDSEAVRILKKAIKKVKIAQEFVDAVIDQDLGSPWEASGEFPAFTRGEVLYALADYVIRNECIRLPKNEEDEEDLP